MHYLGLKIKQKKHDYFFSGILSVILLLVLILITIIFLTIYSRLHDQMLQSAYTREQENISNISNSAVIMDKAVSSCLDQIYSNTKIQQLIYAKHFQDTVSINSILLFREYVRASTWLDSAYIVNAGMDSVVDVLYTVEPYVHASVSFFDEETFWDQEFLQGSMTAYGSNMPILRKAQLPSTGAEEETFFTYYTVVRSKADTYDGVFVINVNVDRLMDMCYGTAESSGRQIIVAENEDNYYSSNTSLLDDNGKKELFEEIAAQKSVNGQYIVMSEKGEMFCTWKKENDLPFLVISCVPMESIRAQLGPLKFWLIIFYCSVLLIFAVSILVVMRTLWRKYALLQKLYDKEVRRYYDNHSYVNDTLLRDFVTSKEEYDLVTERFRENNIDLETYRCYSLLLFEIKSIGITTQPETGSTLRAALQGVFAAASEQRYRYEIADVFQNRRLLIMESADESEIKRLVQRVNEILPEKCGYNIRCLYTVNVSALFDIPREYQFMTGQAGLLYFYQDVACMNTENLRKRDFVGYSFAEKMSEQILAQLKTKNFDEVSALFSEFFEKWFEPAANQERTLDLLIRVMTNYVKNLIFAYAVSMDFDEMAFRSNVYRCACVENVKVLFLDLVEDLRLVVCGSGQHNRYVDAVLEIIHADYANVNLNPEFIAEQIGLSVSHVQSVFRTETGTSISRYLRQYRLGITARLLKETDISVNVIAEQAGFGNQNYYLTLFKKYYKMTPSEYRIRMRED